MVGFHFWSNLPTGKKTQRLGNSHFYTAYASRVRNHTHQNRLVEIRGIICQTDNDLIQGIKLSLTSHQDHTLPRRSKILVGLDGSGKFRTSEAKEHPWLLSKLHDSCARNRTRHQLPSVAWHQRCALGLAQVARTSSRINANAVWLPDYQRWA